MGNKNAFSLLEVAVALGIISFAIVGIMGLLPVALNASIEAQRETRAAFIARSVFADFEAGKIAFPNQDTVSSTNFFFADNGVLATTPAEKAVATFEAEIKRVPATLDNTNAPAVPQIEVVLSTPVAAKFTTRSKYVFVQTIRKE